MDTCMYAHQSFTHNIPHTHAHIIYTHTLLIDCIVVEEKLLQQEPHTDGLPPAQHKLPSLKQDQYTILHGVLDNPAQYLSNAEQLIQEHPGDNSNISNGPKLERTSDRKRKSVTVERGKSFPGGR